MEISALKIFYIAVMSLLVLIYTAAAKEFNTIESSVMPRESFQLYEFIKTKNIVIFVSQATVKNPSTDEIIQQIGRHNVILVMNSSKSKDGNNFEIDYSYTIKYDLLFLIHNITEIDEFHDDILENPALIKIMYAVQENCSDDELFRNDIIFSYFHKIWTLDKVINIFYASKCSTYSNVAALHYYNPFENRLLRIDIPSALDNEVINDIVKQLNGLRTHNLNNITLTAVLFPSSMAYLKSATYLYKTLTKADIGNELTTINAFFGLDVSILEELAIRMNFTLKIQGPTDNLAYGFKEPSGKFNGALGDVIYKRADFVANGLFLKDYESRLIEFSSVFSDEKLCVVTRKADLIPKSLLIFRCFSLNVWIAILATVFVVSLKFIIIMNVGDKIIIGLDVPYNATNISHTSLLDVQDHIHNRLIEYFRLPFRIISVLVSAPTTDIGTSPHEQIFITICFLWSLNLSGAFQGSLVDVYTTPTSYPDINTLNELDDSNIPIAVRHQGLIVDIFGSEKPGTVLGNLRMKMIPTEDDFLYDRISVVGDVAGLERLTSFAREALKYLRQDGVSLLNIISECPRSYNLAYVFPRQSPLLGSVNGFINLFLEAGLIDKWIKDTKEILRHEAEIQNRHFIHLKHVQLTLAHLQIAFIILGIGAFFSFCMLLFELITFQKLN